MHAEFSDSFWDHLVKYYRRPHNFSNPDFDISEEADSLIDAYELGVKDGKTELAHDIFEHLGRINYN